MGTGFLSIAHRNRSTGIALASSLPVDSTRDPRPRHVPQLHTQSVQQLSIPSFKENILQALMICSQACAQAGQRNSAQATLMEDLQIVYQTALGRHLQNPSLSLQTCIEEEVLMASSRQPQILILWRKIKDRWGVLLPDLFKAQTNNQVYELLSGFVRREINQGNLVDRVLQAFKQLPKHFLQNLHQIRERGFSKGLSYLFYEKGKNEELNRQVYEQMIRLIRYRGGEAVYQRAMASGIRAIEAREEVLNSFRRMSLVGANLPEFVSVFLNQASSLSSMMLGRLLARQRVSSQNFLVSAMLGGMIGAIQAGGQLFFQWQHFSEEQKLENRTHLLWEFSKSVGIGAASGTISYFGAVSLRRFGLMNNVSAKRVNFVFSEAGGEVGSTYVAEYAGRNLGLEEEQVLRGTWFSTLFSNVVEEKFGNLHGRGLRILTSPMRQNSFFETSSLFPFNPTKEIPPLLHSSEARPLENPATFQLKIMEQRKGKGIFHLPDQTRSSVRNVAASLTQDVAPEGELEELGGSLVKRGKIKNSFAPGLFMTSKDEGDPVRLDAPPVLSSLEKAKKDLKDYFPVLMKANDLNMGDLDYALMQLDCIEQERVEMGVRWNRFNFELQLASAHVYFMHSKPRISRVELDGMESFGVLVRRLHSRQMGQAFHFLDRNLNRLQYWEALETVLSVHNYPLSSETFQFLLLNPLLLEGSEEDLFKAWSQVADYMLRQPNFSSVIPREFFGNLITYVDQLQTIDVKERELLLSHFKQIWLQSIMEPISRTEGLDGRVHGLEVVRNEIEQSPFLSFQEKIEFLCKVFSRPFTPYAMARALYKTIEESTQLSLRHRHRNLVALERHPAFVTRAYQRAVQLYQPSFIEVIPRHVQRPADLYVAIVRHFVEKSLGRKLNQKEGRILQYEFGFFYEWMLHLRDVPPPLSLLEEFANEMLEYQSNTGNFPSPFLGFYRREDYSHCLLGPLTPESLIRTALVNMRTHRRIFKKHAGDFFTERSEWISAFENAEGESYPLSMGRGVAEVQSGICLILYPKNEVRHLDLENYLAKIQINFAEDGSVDIVNVQGLSADLRSKDSLAKGVQDFTKEMGGLRPVDALMLCMIDIARQIKAPRVRMISEDFQFSYQDAAWDFKRGGFYKGLAKSFRMGPKSVNSFFHRGIDLELMDDPLFLDYIRSIFSKGEGAQVFIERIRPALRRFFVFKRGRGEVLEEHFDFENR